MGNNAGGVTIDNEAGTFDGDTAGNALVLDTGNTIVNGGTIEATDGGTLRIVNSTLDNEGSIVADGGTVFVGGPVTGGGSATIEDNGTLELGSTDAQTVTFNDASTLVLDHQDQGDSQSFTGAISGFGQNDVVDLTDVAYGSNEDAVWTQATVADGGSGTLAIFSGDTLEATLNLNGIYTPGEFALASDGAAANPGTDVELNYISFSNGTINTDNVTPVISNAGSTLQLTDSNGSEAASWFATDKVAVGSFTASFDYQATPQGGGLADGMAFILQDDPNGSSALGGNGSSLGYGPAQDNTGGTAISPSAAVELNLYDAGGSHVPGTNFVTDGGYGSYISTGNVDFADTGDQIQVVLSYDGNALSETLTDLVNGDTFSTTYDNVNLAQILDCDTAYVGFSAATGGGVSTQTVSEFTFTAEASPPPPPPPVDTWTGNADGLDWSTDGNWSGGAPPADEQAAIPDGDDPFIISNVTLDNVTLQNGITDGATINVVSGAILTLLDDTVISNGTLSIDSQSEVEVQGGENGSATLDDVTVDNSGTLQIDGAATLAIADTVILQGGGSISLAGTGDSTMIAGQLDNSENPAQLNNIDNTISGIGTIGDGSGDLVLTNEAAGVIDASGGTITIDTGSTDINAGLMEATNGGTLVIDDHLNNSGTVLADGGTVVVSFGASPGLGGTGSVTIAGGGVVDLAGDAFQNVTFAGAGTLEAESNHGTITRASASATYMTFRAMFHTSPA